MSVIKDIKKEARDRSSIMFLLFNFLLLSAFAGDPNNQLAFSYLKYLNDSFESPLCAILTGKKIYFLIKIKLRRMGKLLDKL